MCPNTPVSPKKRRRFLGLALLLIFSFILLLIQFYSLQIVEGKKWALRAQKQHYFIFQEPYHRGRFFGNVSRKTNHPRSVQPLVTDLPIYHLCADPLMLHSKIKEEVADALHVYLTNYTSHEQLLKHLGKPSRHRVLCRGLSPETRTAIQQWWYPYARQNHLPRNALFFTKDYRRCYPYGHLLGPVLHTVREQKDEKTLRAVPTGGLELFFDRYLTGRVGKRRLLRSPSHPLEIGEVIREPENGADIYLTIDPDIQAIVEEELERGVKRSQAANGWAVMMDPANGKIMALAQYPFFHPEKCASYFDHEEKIGLTKVWAITDANEPGSVFKPFMAAIALEANRVLEQKGQPPLFSIQEKIATANGIFPGRSKPITDTSLHFFLNLDMAMQKSSNIYMSILARRIVERLGSEWFYEQLLRCGFGVKTGIELPAESRGVLPKPGRLYPNGVLQWSTPTPFSIAFGHNLQATTLQLARAYCLLANGGLLVNPTLIDRITKKDKMGNEVVLFDHSKSIEKELPRPFSHEIIARVLESMRYVTKPGGTASRADIGGYTEVGKSSTPKKIVNGRYSEKIYCPTFAGFAPVEAPCFVLVITINEPGYGYTAGIGKNHNGGNCTAHVFREIGKRTLAFLSVPRDDPAGYPYGDPRRKLDEEKWMPKVKELKGLYDEWNHRKDIKRP